MADVTVPEIAAMLNQDAEALATYIFPSGKKFGGYLNVGSIAGEPGKSLKIKISGNKMGSWADYSRDVGDIAGKGDMLKLVQLTLGNGDIAKAVQWAKGYLGLGDMDNRLIQKQRDRAVAAAEKAKREEASVNEKKRLNAIGLWKFAEPMQGTPAQKYLEARGIDFSILGFLPSAIRFHPQIYNGDLQRKVPAMVSMFVGVDGRQSAIHITYLELMGGEWRKLSGVDNSKKIWSPMYWTAHIPLCKEEGGKTLRDIGDGVPVYSAEGIENALSWLQIAMQQGAPKCRVVAAGTLGNQGAMLLPQQAGDFHFLGDNDPDGSPADQSLEKQIGKQQMQADGRISKDGELRQVKMHWPVSGYKDFNDQLRGIRLK